MRRFSFVWLQYGDFFVCRCGVCVLCCCVLLFEIPGVSNAKAVRFWFCFYVQIPIACHVRAISPAPAKALSCSGLQRFAISSTASFLGEINQGCYYYCSQVGMNFLTKLTMPMIVLIVGLFEVLFFGVGRSTKNFYAVVTNSDSVSRQDVTQVFYLFRSKLHLCRFEG